MFLKGEIDTDGVCKDAAAGDFFSITTQERNLAVKREKVQIDFLAVQIKQATIWFVHAHPPGAAVVVRVTEDGAMAPSLRSPSSTLSLRDAAVARCGTPSSPCTSSVTSRVCSWHSSCRS